MNRDETAFESGLISVHCCRFIACFRLKFRNMYNRRKGKARRKSEEKKNLGRMNELISETYQDIKNAKLLSLRLLY